MGEEEGILLRGKVCAYLTCRLIGNPKFPFLHFLSLLEENRNGSGRTYEFDDGARPTWPG